MIEESLDASCAFNTGPLPDHPIATSTEHGTHIQSLMRENINGALQRQITLGNQHTQQAGSRTNADLLREVGNLAGLNLSEFGLASQNKGDVLI